MKRRTKLITAAGVAEVRTDTPLLKRRPIAWLLLLVASGAACQPSRQSAQTSPQQSHTASQPSATQQAQTGAKETDQPSQKTSQPEVKAIDRALDEYGRTTLMLAAKRGDCAKCGELILMGADVNARDKEGNTPLILALWGGYEESERRHKPRSAIVLETVQLLLDKGADVNAANTNGYTPIMCAPDPRFAKGHLPIVRALVRRGAKVNARTHDGWTPLMAAAHGGDVAMVRFLLSQGADAKARMELLGYTARDFAAFQGHSGVVALLDNAKPQ